MLNSSSSSSSSSSPMQQFISRGEKVLNKYLIPSLTHMIIDYIKPIVTMKNTDSGKEFTFTSQMLQGIVYVEYMKNKHTSYVLQVYLQPQVKGKAYNYSSVYSSPSIQYNRNTDAQTMSVTMSSSKRELKRTEMDDIHHIQIHRYCREYPNPLDDPRLYLLEKKEGIEKIRFLDTIKDPLQPIVLPSDNGIWLCYTFERTIGISTCYLIWLEDVIRLEMMYEIEAIENILSQQYGLEIQILLSSS